MQFKTSQRTKIFIKNWYHGNFWKVHRSLSRCLKSEKKPGYLRAKLSKLANIYWSSYKPTQNKLRKHGILKKLIIMKDIVIVTPNKWNDVVFLDGNIYDQKLMILQSLRKRKIMPLKQEKKNNSVFWVKSRKKIFLIKICIRKSTTVVLNWLLFTVFLKHLGIYLILLTFLFDQLFLP